MLTSPHNHSIDCDINLETQSTMPFEDDSDSPSQKPANAAMPPLPLELPHVSMDSSAKATAVVAPTAPSTLPTKPEYEIFCPTPAPASTPPRITIHLPGNDVEISPCAQVVFAEFAKRKTLYFRQTGICTLINGNLHHVSPPMFRCVIEEIGRTYHMVADRVGGFVPRPKPCPEDTAKALLSSKYPRELLPHINICVKLPTLALIDGKPKLLPNGWSNFNGGIYTCGSTDKMKLPRLDEAINAILHILQDCDFATPSDKSRAVASLLSPALKMGGWISGFVPLDFAEADQSQSGKSYRQRVIAAVYGEEMMVVTQRGGGVGHLDEDIGSRLAAGAPFIQIDNYRGKLDSPYLEAILTCKRTIAVRIPYQGQAMISPAPYMWYLSTNGLEATKDILNRANIIRICKRPDSYEWASYPEGDLLSHVEASEGYYLSCIHAVLVAWHAAGRPREKQTRHSFADWARSCDWIVQNIFNLAPLMDNHEAAATRASSPIQTWLREIALCAIKDGRATWTATSLAELAISTGTIVPGVAPDMAFDVTASMKRVGCIMREVFKDSESLDFEGLRVARTLRTGRDGHPAKFYEFARFEPIASASASKAITDDELIDRIRW